MQRPAWLPWLLVAVAAPAAAWAAAGPGTAFVSNLRFAREAARLAPAAPVVLAAPPLGSARGVTMPWRVGIQAGHWNIAELPDEQARLRVSTGTRWGSIREVDLNVRIAGLVADALQKAGVVVDLLPASVPAGYEADAFVAIHADDGSGRSVSGWKVAAPRRSSLASRMLRDEIAWSYGRTTGLGEDRYGVTFNMRGYYAFSWTRYEHAISPVTPAAIIETGFVHSAEDRRILVDAPEKAALGISMGILAYLSERPRLATSDLVPFAYPAMIVTTEAAVVRYFPTDTERIAARLPAGTLVRPTDQWGGWVELTVRGSYRVAGWMKLSDLEIVGG